MKRFSTFVCALALLLVGAGSAKAEKVYEVTYSTYDSFPFYVMGFTPEWVGGIMVDGGGGWHQYFIADKIPTVVGGNYKVKALVKASANVTFNVNMGWGWSDGQTTGTNVTVPQSDDFKEVVWEYSNIGGTSCNLVAQPNSDATIQWKQLTVYTADPKEVTTYGDLVDVTPTMHVKNYGGDTNVATPNADGIIEITDAAGSGDAWATQFWIAGEYPLPAGKKFYVEFDYKAVTPVADPENDGHFKKVGTQTHAATPGSYITWHCIGDLEFTESWQHFENEVTIASDMNGWQSIAFNMHLNGATTYQIKNVVLKEPEIVGENVDVMIGSTGWTSFSCAKNVSLGSAKGYAAKAHGTYVELIPVTEVPANNAVLIEGTGKYTFDVIASAAAITDNDLQISNGSVTGDGSTIFALGKKDDEVGFMKVKNGTKIPAGKAYIVIAGGSAREFIGFGENETTGIEAVQQNAKADNQYFNLAGQRVAQPTKGLYIVNGKKVIIK